MTASRTNGQEGHCGTKREKRAFIDFSSKEHRMGWGEKHRTQVSIFPPKQCIKTFIEDSTCCQKIDLELSEYCAKCCEYQKV
jgi:hypothetical protein